MQIAYCNLHIFTAALQSSLTHGGPSGGRAAGAPAKLKDISHALTEMLISLQEVLSGNVHGYGVLDTFYCKALAGSSIRSVRSRILAEIAQVRSAGAHEALRAWSPVVHLHACSPLVHLALDAHLQCLEPTTRRMHAADRASRTFQAAS
jgi:hypothetical protein